MDVHRQTTSFPRTVLLTALLAFAALTLVAVAGADAHPAKKSDHHHRASRHADRRAAAKHRKKKAGKVSVPSSSATGELSEARAFATPSTPMPPNAETTTGTGTGRGEVTGTSPSEPSQPSNPGSTQTPPLENTIEIPTGARYVSASTGSDSNAGTEASPWKTLAQAASAAKPGDTVVLLPGAYGALGITTSLSRSGNSGAPITFTSKPGSPDAVIKGYVRITGSHLLVNSLTFEGPTGPVLAQTSSNPGGQEVQVSIMYNSDVELRNSEIRNNAWHAGVYVYADENIRINSNYIHDNGDATTGANLDHGVYWCAGSGEVSDNTISNNVSYGVQLYPEAVGVTVARNTITGNGRGGIIVADGSAQNQLIENLVSENAYYGIRAYDLTGPGNLARANFLWSNPENISGTGISYTETRLQRPTA